MSAHCKSKKNSNEDGKKLGKGASFVSISLSRLQRCFSLSYKNGREEIFFLLTPSCRLRATISSSLYNVYCKKGRCEKHLFHGLVQSVVLMGITSLDALAKICQKYWLLENTAQQIFQYLPVDTKNCQLISAFTPRPSCSCP